MARLDDIITSQPPVRKGRGALSNEDHRYSPVASEFDPAEEAPERVTECRAVRARSIISRNQSPDVPFEQSINPYQGCEHGCIYCYARPTHAYLDLSPGLDFETRLTCKTNAAEQLEKELSRPGYRCRSITLGANTDPYQPVEKNQRITRSVLEVLQRYRHPFTLITKGSLVTRDLDILAEMAGAGLCSVAVSITTLDAELKRLMEPRAASAQARLQSIAILADAGVPVTVLFAPVIPALNDRDMESVLRESAAAGANSAAYILLRLPLEIRALFEEWLQAHFPLRAEHVMSLVRQCRGGAAYDTRFGHRMRGSGPFAELLQRRFRVCCRKLGLGESETAALRTDLFAPLQVGGGAQQDLFL
jgi:DNA repair photolyase